jgi:hypothetical protein
VLSLEINFSSTVYILSSGLIHCINLVCLAKGCNQNFLIESQSIDEGRGENAVAVSG